MDIFINSLSAISAQETFDNDDFLSDIHLPDQNKFQIVTPNYKSFLDAKKIRRMSKMMKMGLASAIVTTSNATFEKLDAIVVGTGMGCLMDTEKFLFQMVDDGEKLLNPTSFIQSTHNTVAGAIALYLSCNESNFTFTQNDVSFECALNESMMLMQEDGKENVLVGGIDELTDTLYEHLYNVSCAQKKNQRLPNGQNACALGEGATFFCLSSQKGADSKTKISGLSLFNSQYTMDSFLSQLEIDNHAIDAIILGCNGEQVYDSFYEESKKRYAEIPQIEYKHVVGQYDTVSAFSLWLASEIIEKQVIPKALLINDKFMDKIHRVLIHNYSLKYGHSFMLIEQC